MEISSWGKHLLSVLGPLPRHEDASIMLSVIIRQLSDARIRWRCRSRLQGRCLLLYGSSCTTMSHIGTIRLILQRNNPPSIYTAYCKVTNFVVLATRLYKLADALCGLGRPFELLVRRGNCYIIISPLSLVVGLPHALMRSHDATDSAEIVCDLDL